MPGVTPTWYLFGTLLVASTILLFYGLTRDQLLTETTAQPATRSASSETHASARSQTTDAETVSTGPVNPVDHHQLSISQRLALLPDDERQVVEPILASPGLTQVELRGRSGFSKAKVSQTVSTLEDRGLIYREKQGRTYRVYPGELLKDNQS